MKSYHQLSNLSEHYKINISNTTTTPDLPIEESACSTTKEKTLLQAMETYHSLYYWKELEVTINRDWDYALSSLRTSESILYLSSHPPKMFNKAWCCGIEWKQL